MFRVKIRYGENFLEKLVGKKILSNPIVALIELLANSWDEFDQIGIRDEQS